MTECARCSSPSDAPACWHCAVDAEKALDYIAAVGPQLDVTLTRQDRVGGGGSGRASAEEPLPINLHASDVGHAIRNTLTTWARIITDAHGIDWPPRGTPARAASLREVAEFMRGHIGWLRRQDWAVEVICELVDASRDLERAVDTPPDMIELGKCDAEGDDGQKCGAELRAVKGAPWTTCRACRTPYDVERRREQLLDRVKGLTEPANVCAAILTAWMDTELPASTIRGWAHDKKLRKRGVTTDGRPRYRIGDVHTLQLKALADKAREDAETQNTEQNAQDIAA